MTPRRFDWALRTRGPDLATWPETERDAALALLRTDRAAQAALADAMADDDLPAADDPALHRMQAAVRRALAPPPPVVRGMRWGAMAACVAAGLYLGLLPIEADRAADPAFPEAAFTLQATSLATVLAALDP